MITRDGHDAAIPVAAVVDTVGVEAGKVRGPVGAGRVGRPW
jgi:hypothetical protein